jgi:regulator of sigma E protease
MPDILQNILIYGGSFVFVLSLVVFVHEFGHFQAARWCKVAIDTFSIGFGKTLFGWRDKQGVQWKVGALPLGGYVKFADDVDAMSTPVAPINDPVAKAEARRKGLFHAQTLTTRSIVVAAGPIANFIFSITAFAVLAFIVGRDVARVDSIQPDSPAAAAGLQAGDIILAVDGRPVGDFMDLQQIVSVSPGRELTLLLRREGAEVQVPITPRAVESEARDGSVTRTGVLGVGHQASLESYEPIGPLDAISEGATRTWEMVAQTGSYVGSVFAGRESGDQIAGPLGILNVSGQVAQSALDAPDQDIAGRVKLLALSLLGLAAMLSVAVGIVNLLPIPILDGGHLLFYAIEALRGGRPLPPVAQEWAYRAGFAVMASLFLFATWNDITRHLAGSQG